MNHRNKEDLTELYIERGLSTYQCAEIFGCSNSTVLRWLHKHDIDVRPSRREGVNRGSYFTDRDGYERVVINDPDQTRTVAVSQVTAIAHGADPEKVFSDGDYHVHHRNTIPWDNRPENLEVVHYSEHNEIHNEDNWVFDKRLGCNVLDSKQRYGRSNREETRANYANPDWYYAI